MRRPELVSTERPETPDRRLLLLLVAGVLLVGVSLGGVVSRLLQTGPGPQGMAESWPVKPKLPAAPVPAEEEAPPPAPKTAARPALTTERFLRLLVRESPRPVALSIARAFNERPALRRAWTEFDATRGRNAPAKDFIRTVLRLPDFREVLVAHRGDPEFREAFQRIARNPEVAAALRSEGPARPPGPSRGFAPGGGRRGSPPAGAPGFGPRRAGGPKVASAGPAEDEEEPSLGGRRSSFGSEQATGPGGPESEAAGQRDRERRQADMQAAHDVIALEKLSTKKVADRNVGGYFASMIASMPRKVKKEMELACQENDEMCDPINACAEHWQDCLDACAKSPHTCPEDIRSLAVQGNLSD